MILSASCNWPIISRAETKVANGPQLLVSAVSHAHTKHPSRGVLELSQVCRTSIPAAVAAKRGGLIVCPAISRSLPGDDDTTPLIATLRAMEPASVADTLWAKMLSRGADNADFSAVAHVIKEDISRYSPSSLVAVLSAMAEAGFVDPALLAVVAEKLRQPESMAALSSSELTTLTWSLAMLNMGAGTGDLEELLGAVARHASRLIMDFVPSDLARLLGGLGELRHRNQLLLEKAAGRLSVSLIPMAQLTIEDIAKVVFAFARLDAYDRDLFDAAAKEIVRTTQKGVSPQAAAQDLVVAAYAYSRVKHSLPKLMQAIGDMAIEILHATESSPVPTVDATVLLDLARVVASVQHHNPEYYGPTLDQLLLAVNKTYNATDIESMSQHCGATDINGLQK
ncbi:hypothetical protein DUNSADRAFT_1854 [Dunaliella salina]|uniref:RNA-editing substrate-binding complex 6 protein domain-containing protein n=1 Tax=Dunaliella salina TaxID=3046 RepID=A0ABQ7GWK3_DUNSA|nr:hypothetical protein DUNSADRAFT_1854 [Dunaliella salina]|eukprot:KAF5838987.1 hypothetical protein DUNSADRAFT_1854 [Dunaliella salina]